MSPGCSFPKEDMLGSYQLKKIKSLQLFSKVMDQYFEHNGYTFFLE